jgi:hypothetical protein
MEVNAGKIKCRYIPQNRNLQQIYDKSDKWFENISRFDFLETAITRNWVRHGIRRRMNS